MDIDCSRCRLRPLVAADAASLAHHANDRGVWVNLRDRFPIEALRATTTYAFEQRALARVFAVPFATTSRSARVLEKAGYVREGVMRLSAVKEGVLLDQVLYAAYADRWLQ